MLFKNEIEIGFTCLFAAVVIEKSLLFPFLFPFFFGGGGGGVGFLICFKIIVLHLR
jgi:hypothetical protein